MGKQTQQTTKQTIVSSLQPRQGWCPPLKTNTMLRVCYESKIITNIKLHIRVQGEGEREEMRKSQPEIYEDPHQWKHYSYQI